MGLRWLWLRFDELTRDQLYQILGLRERVFIVEQKCVYPDIDGRDVRAHHLLGLDGAGALVAYLRLVAPGHRYAEPSVGRVVTDPAVRGRGFGHALMREAIRRAEEAYPGMPIRMSAQRYLERFYTAHGFVAVGDPYDEDGIEHREMVRNPR
jgi:ElaA protein